MPEEVKTPATPVAPPPAPKPEIKSTLTLSRVQGVDKVKKVDPVTKKPVRDAEDKIVMVDKPWVLMAPKAPGATDDAYASPSGFLAWLNTYFSEGSVIPDFWPTFRERHKFTDLFDHVTEAATFLDGQGKPSLSSKKYFDALYFGAPRSMNTISSVGAQLNELKGKYADFQFIKQEVGDDAAKLAAAVKEIGFETPLAFANAATELFMKIKTVSAQLKTLKAQKEARDAKKAEEALKAPAAPVK